MKDPGNQFITQPDKYVRFRPRYPDALFQFIADSAPGRSLVWDAGTGNGQAAIGLAAHFQKVHATDPSQEQLKHALKHPGIQYAVEPGETCSLPASSADAGTIGNALHWFDRTVFYQEVRRVVKPGGVIFAWGYKQPVVSKAIDQVISELHNDILGKYWLPQNGLTDLAYTTLDFPFPRIEAPEFYSRSSFTINDLLGYLDTWSAVERYVRQNKTSPVDLIEEKLRAAWGSAETRIAAWHLFMLAGKL